MVFPVVMYGCESWTVKKAECRRIDAFELWCWRRLLRVPWTARRSNPSILKEISPGCSQEGLMLKLNLQYFGHLMQRVDSLEETLMLGGIEGRRKGGGQRMRTEMLVVPFLRNPELEQCLAHRKGYICVCCYSVQFSRSVVSDYLRLHELQHARPVRSSTNPEFTQSHVH